MFGCCCRSLELDGQVQHKWETSDRQTGGKIEIWGMRNGLGGRRKGREGQRGSAWQTPPHSPAFQLGGPIVRNSPSAPG